MHRASAYNRVQALELGWFRGTAQTACLPRPPGRPPRALPDPQREALLWLDDLHQATFLGHLAALPYRTFLATRIQSASAESAVRRHLRLQPPAPGILPAPWAAHPDLVPPPDSVERFAMELNELAHAGHPDSDCVALAAYMLANFLPADDA